MLVSSINDKEHPSTAIILLNWNAYKDSFECIKSLETLDYPNFHVFIVDNDSQDDSFQRLQRDNQEGEFGISITFLQSGANLGFAGGNNVGIAKAYEQGYYYIWMLNNDTTVESDTLSSLIAEIHNDMKIGIVGSKIYYYGMKVLWFAGGEVNEWTGTSKHIGIKEEDNGQYNLAQEVGYITGCSLLFRRELIDSIGYMHEDYFLYYEETDWNIRAKQNGWKVKYVPDSIVYHKVSISSGGEDNLAPYVAYYDIRNAFMMVKRTKNELILLLAFNTMIWKVIKKHLKIIIHNQNLKQMRSRYIWRGFIDGIQGKMGKHPSYK